MVQVLVGFIGTASGTLDLRRLNGGALGSTGVVQFRQRLGQP